VTLCLLNERLNVPFAKSLVLVDCTYTAHISKYFNDDNDIGLCQVNAVFSILWHT